MLWVLTAHARHCCLVLSLQAATLAKKYQVLVLDESHYIKDPGVSNGWQHASSGALGSCPSGTGPVRLASLCFTEAAIHAWLGGDPHETSPPMCRPSAARPPFH